MKRPLSFAPILFVSLAACSNGTASNPDVVNDSPVVTADVAIDVSSDTTAISDASTDVGSDATTTGDGSSVDNWANFAEGFFTSYCVSCHGPTTADTHRDYTLQSQIQRDAMLIRCGVSATAQSDCGSSGLSPRQFPIGTGPQPTDADRNRVVAWLLAGAL